MIICINCSPATKDKMDDMLNKGQYREYSELISVAVDNLWMLEREVAEKGAFVLAEKSAPQTAPSSFPPAKKAALLKAAKAKTAPASPAPAHIPDLFLVDGKASLSVAAEEIPSLEKVEETYTLDRWLFGQYNKLLPLKANCRALLWMTANNPDGVALEEIAPRIGEVAALLGDYLAEHDREHQIGRDNSLATAFPRSGPDAEKGRTRYANQFVGSVNSQGVLYGLLSDYRFALLSPRGCTCLRPTEPAIDFARLANPVLDVSQVNPAQKFSAEEITFLIDHIKTNVPVEDFAFRTLVRAIADGADTPDKLDEALRAFVPTDTNRSLSPSFLTSQRSGALSRMADLGLIARHRKGVRVSYTVTEQGQHYIESN